MPHEASVVIELEPPSCTANISVDNFPALPATNLTQGTLQLACKRVGVLQVVRRPRFLGDCDRHGVRQLRIYGSSPTTLRIQVSVSCQRAVHGIHENANQIGASTKQRACAM
jgi:hypothetical protein